MGKLDRAYKYPGIRLATDGNGAVIMAEREAADAAGAYPITPSTPMGEYWAEEAATGHVNISGRPLIFIEPEGEHAAAVTAGLAMTGLMIRIHSLGGWGAITTGKNLVLIDAPIDDDESVRRTHGKDGRGLQGHPHGRAGAR